VTEGNAILLLLDVLGRTYNRPIRVLDLYIYLRRALVPGAIPSEVRDVLSNYDSSMLFLVLEGLRAGGFVRGSGNAFVLTDAGKTHVERVRTQFALAVESLTSVAAQLAA